MPQIILSQFPIYTSHIYLIFLVILLVNFGMSSHQWVKYVKHVVLAGTLVPGNSNIQLNNSNLEMKELQKESNRKQTDGEIVQDHLCFEGFVRSLFTQMG
jgi:hypothetical protein